PVPALESADMIEPVLLADAGCQGFNPQVKGHHFPRLLFGFLYPVAEGSIVVASSISTDSHFSKALWRDLCQFCFDVWILFRAMFTAATCGQDQGLAFDLNVHGRVNQCEKAMAGTYSRKSWLFSIGNPTKERLHGRIQAKVNFMQELPIDLLQL